MIEKFKAWLQEYNRKALAKKKNKTDYEVELLERWNRQR